MSFKGFKQKDLKANEYVKFLKNLDKVRLDVEDKINQSADIMNTKAKARQEMNAPIIKALGKTEADFAEIDKKISDEQMTSKIANVLKGSNAEIVDFFTNDYFKAIEDDDTGMQLVFDPDDPTKVTLGDSEVLMNPEYTQITILGIDDVAKPLFRGLLLLLLLKLEDLKAYGALSGLSKDDIDVYLTIVTNGAVNPPGQAEATEKFIELVEIFKKKISKEVTFKAKSSRAVQTKLYDSLDPSNKDLERFNVDPTNAPFSKEDVKKIYGLFKDETLNFFDVLTHVSQNPGLKELNELAGEGNLGITLLDNIFVRSGAFDPSRNFKEIPGDATLPTAEYFVISSKKKLSFTETTKGKGKKKTVVERFPSKKSGSAYFFVNYPIKSLYYRKYMPGSIYESEVRINTTNAYTRFATLLGDVGIIQLARYCTHFYAKQIMELDKEIRDNPGDAGNAAREKEVKKLQTKIEKVTNRFDPNIHLEKPIYGTVVDLVRRFRKAKGGALGGSVSEGGRMMSPEKFKEIKEMKKIEASNPINLTGGMISMKPAGKPKGRKPANGLYMLKNNQFGGLTIDMPQLFNNMKIKAMKGGSIAYEGIADKDTIDLLTKRYDSRRTYSGLAQKNIAKLIQMSELPPSENSAKLKMTQRYITSKRARKGLKGGKIPEMDELIAMIGSLNAGNTPNKKLNNQIFDLAAKLVKSGDLDMETYKQILNNYT